MATNFSCAQPKIRYNFEYDVAVQNIAKTTSEVNVWDRLDAQDVKVKRLVSDPHSPNLKMALISYETAEQVKRGIDLINGRALERKMLYAFVIEEWLAHVMEVEKACISRGYNIDHQKNVEVTGMGTYMNTLSVLRANFAAAGSITNVALFDENYAKEVNGGGTLTMSFLSEAMAAEYMLHESPVLGEQVKVKMVANPCTEMANMHCDLRMNCPICYEHFEDSRFICFQN